MTRRHHHTCRCNDCVRRRNANRRRRENEDADRGRPRHSGATWYEVERDEPITYEDDVRQREQRERERLQDLERLFDAPLSQPPNYEGEREQTEPQRRENEDRYRRAQEEYLERARQQREEEKRRRQARAASREASLRQEQQRQEVDEQRSRAEEERERGAEERPREHTACQQGEPTPSDSGESDDVIVPASARPATNPVERRGTWQLLMPLLITLILLVAIISIGVLAYLLPIASTKAATRDDVEPTPDLNATVVAAVALTLTPMIPSPAEPSTDTILSGPEPTDVSAMGQGDARPTRSPTLSSTGRLQEMECSDCVFSTAAPLGYVEWVREPKVSESGSLSFRAQIDERADFIVAGPSCGFENISLTDNTNALYGSVIPRSMATHCGSRPGDWVSNRYYYFDDLLTVTVQIDPTAATHPGLELCLWTGSASSSEIRLLDCIPVQQP